MTTSRKVATGLPPDQAEREKALNIGISALAIAPAGSGKTSLLVARMLKCLALSNEPEEVVAITFTRMAAAEIRARLIETLHSVHQPEPAEPFARTLHVLAGQVLARDAERDWKLLQNPNRLRALTIDSLNAELAARLPLLSGLGGRTNMTEDSRGLFEEAVRELFAELEDDRLSAEDREALKRVLRWGDNRIDVLLDPLCDMLEKREQWLKLVLQILRGEAPADSELLGNLIESRIQIMDARLTDDDKSMLLEILREGSAHSEKLQWGSQLASWPEASAEQLPTWQNIAATLITQKGDLRKLVTVKEGFPAKLPFTAWMKAWLDNLKGDPRADALALACADVVACPQTTYPVHLQEQKQALARVLLLLAGHLRLVFSRRGEADFTEVALAALQALSGEHGYTEVLDRSDARIRHLLVDEMQDTSDAQVRLLERLTSGWTPEDGHSLFMVGDPQQSIYAFRKAEVRLFLDLWNNRKLGDVPLERIQLSTNFRSTKPLIDWFNHSFSAMFPPTEDVYAGTVAFASSEVPASAALEPDPAVSVLPMTNDDEDAEAEAVAKHVALLQKTGGSIAIIARARSHLWQILAALRRHKLPYACQDIDPLHDIPGVREFVNLARTLWHPEDRLAWAVVLRSPLVGLSYADLVVLSRGFVKETWLQKIRRAMDDGAALSDEGRARLQHFQEVLAQADADDLLYGDLPARAEAVWHALGGPAAVSAEELQDVHVAMRHLREAAASGEIDSLQTLKRSLARVYATPSATGVQVLTAHKSKGLEFDHVLLVGCGRTTRGDDRPLLHYRRLQEGLLLVPKPPGNLAEDDPANTLYDFAHSLHKQGSRNELLRLLYVCCTRAKKSLALFASVRFNKEDEAVPASGTFADLLWPVIEHEFEALEPAEAAEEGPALKLPLSPRLPIDYRFVADDITWRPAERRTLRPSEAALDSSASTGEGGDLHARLIGTLFHEAMRKIAMEGVEHWSDGGTSRRQSLAAGFRHLGMPEPQVGAAVDRVLWLIKSTLTSEAGRWLLAPRDWSRAEYALAGHLDGRWVSAVIDRCFLEKDGVYWLIDYKTSAVPVTESERESYLAQAVAQYRPQLESYSRLLEEITGGEVRTALYFPDPGVLRTLDDRN